MAEVVATLDDVAAGGIGASLLAVLLYGLLWWRGKRPIAARITLEGEEHLRVYRSAGYRHTGLVPGDPASDSLIVNLIAQPALIALPLQAGKGQGCV